jgi:hypothetical protein
MNPFASRSVAQMRGLIEQRVDRLLDETFVSDGIGIGLALARCSFRACG